MYNVQTDSRKVKEGDTFIAIKNANRDGHDYIEEAIKNGAKKIICEHCEHDKSKVETIVVDDSRHWMRQILWEKCYRTISVLHIIGVTGTNGKTTTAYLVYQMLNKLGLSCCYIGTIGYYYKDEYKSLNNTTPDTDVLFEILIDAFEKGCRYVVMETSSQALAEDRPYHIWFSEAAFTNLTQDHLDYHKTMEKYIESKRRLFEYMTNKRIAVLNADDEHHKEFDLWRLNRSIFVGYNGKDLTIKNITCTHINTKIDFTYQKKDYSVLIKLIGKFNAYNYLIALVLSINAGLKIDDLINISGELTPPPGRMELIPYKTNSIFVDYAHTPDAVINVLKTANEYKKGKIITILGCGGDRDKTKRPLMGNAAEEYSDYVIFTDDNPRTEDNKTIIESILTGVKKDNHTVIYDRKEAIEKGIDMLEENDILMILGKGHEDYQIIGTEKHHFSDKEIVLDYIKGKEN